MRSLGIKKEMSGARLAIMCFFTRKILDFKNNPNDITGREKCFKSPEKNFSTLKCVHEGFLLGFNAHIYENCIVALIIMHEHIQIAEN
jgi:hypothetical protein